MTRLAWDSIGARLYETGVDRGVLYPSVGAGVVWNGLISVNENSSGGSSKPYYIDGFKYQNVPDPEEFEADIVAYTYPDEFEVCSGLTPIGGGLSIGQQRRSSFGLCYRTKIGNDTHGNDHGHKIHLVYNALASPSAKNYNTISDDPDLITFNWNLTTRPILVTGHKATSYFCMDTTKMTPPLLASIEEILYGTSSTAPSLPTPAELVAMFIGWPELYVIDNGNGTFTVSGPDDIVRLLDARRFQFSGDTVFNNGDGTFEISSSD